VTGRVGEGIPAAIFQGTAHIVPPSPAVIRRVLLRCMSPDLARLGSAERRLAGPLTEETCRSDEVGGTAHFDPNRSTSYWRSPIAIYGICPHVLVDLQPERCDDWRPESNVVGKHPSEFFGA
jgi:hypothetical protein